jgi:hypothetical protein
MPMRDADADLVLRSRARVDSSPRTVSRCCRSHASSPSHATRPYESTSRRMPSPRRRSPTAPTPTPSPRISPSSSPSQRPSRDCLHRKARTLDSHAPPSQDPSTFTRTAVTNPRLAHAPRARLTDAPHRGQPADGRGLWRYRTMTEPRHRWWSLEHTHHPWPRTITLSGRRGQDHFLWRGDARRGRSAALPRFAHAYAHRARHLGDHLAPVALLTGRASESPHLYVCGQT